METGRVRDNKIGDLRMEEDPEAAFEKEDPDGGDGGLFREEGEREDGFRLIAKTQFGNFIKAFGAAFLLIAAYFAFSPYLNGKPADLGGISIFAFLAFAALALGREREILISHEKKTIITRESRLFSVKKEMKRLYAEVTLVHYQGPSMVTRHREQAWVRFEFRDGAKFDCETYGGYVPGSHEFGGAKVEYEY
jgi:hypothetical protein